MLLFVTNKLNLRLIYALQYLSQFNFNIRYKTNCLNTISNTLSQLSILIDKKRANNIEEFDKVDIFVFEIEILKVSKLVEQISRKKKNLIAQTISNKAIFFYVYLIKISANFKKRLLDVYIKFVK